MGKPKEKAPIDENTAAAPLTGGEPKAGLDPEAMQRREFWDEAVAALGEMEFGSTEDAIHAIIDKVIDKVSSPNTPDEQIREFLFDLFDTDPELKEELKGLLSVG